MHAWCCKLPRFPLSRPSEPLTTTAQVRQATTRRRRTRASRLQMAAQAVASRTAFTTWVQPPFWHGGWTSAHPRYVAAFFLTRMQVALVLFASVMCIYCLSIHSDTNDAALRLLTSRLPRVLSCRPCARVKDNYWSMPLQPGSAFNRNSDPWHPSTLNSTHEPYNEMQSAISSYTTAQVQLLTISEHTLTTWEQTCNL